MRMSSREIFESCMSLTVESLKFLPKMWRNDKTHEK